MRRSSIDSIVSRHKEWTVRLVGYVVDGSVDDKDVISLILYWADKGYLKMKEKGQKDMEFIKLKDIPDSEPRYQKTMFEALFKNRKKVKLLLYSTNLQIPCRW